MAKRKHRSHPVNRPVPYDRPKELSPFTRSTTETTQSGLDAILTDCLKTARNACKKGAGSAELIDSPYGKRRLEAIQNTFSSILNHRGFTEAAQGFYTAAELWNALNLYTSHTLEQLDTWNFLLLGAAIWLLDNVNDFWDLDDILADVDWEENWELPFLYSPNYSKDMISAVHYVLEHRTASKRYILDVEAKPGTTANAFNALLGLIDPADLRRAIAHTRTLFWEYVDRFFDVEKALVNDFAASVDKYNAQVDKLNRLIRQLVEGMDQRFSMNKGPSSSLSAGSMIPGSPMIAGGSTAPGSPMMAGGSATPGSPMMAGGSATPGSPMMPWQASPMRPGNSEMPGRAGLVGESGKTGKTNPFDFVTPQWNLTTSSMSEEDPSLMPFLGSFNPLISLGESADRAHDEVDKRAEEMTQYESKMIVYCFDFSCYGFANARRYRTEMPTGQLLSSAQDLPNFDPWEICAGVLLLCSEDALRRLYADIPGATPERDLDLPWLLGSMEGMLADVLWHLPWGVHRYDPDDVPFDKRKLKLPHLDLNTLAYDDEDGNRRNLSHLIYEATGAILPLDMEDFDGMSRYLTKQGMSKKLAGQVTELMTVLEAVQFREELSTKKLSDPVNEDTVSEDVEELKEQLKELRDRLKKVTDAAHTQDQRARKAEAALAAEREKMAADRAELAGLREVVFTADSRDDEHISVTLPYEVKQRSVIFGGHDMWQKPMKEFLTGDVRFIDRDMVAFDTDVIRNAEVIWIQTNAISHKMYYKIMDAVRKWRIPVKYFLYASARKCAEQIVLEDGE